MDGMLHGSFDLSRLQDAAPLFGVLFAEDFDDPPPTVSRQEPELEQVAPLLTQADIVAACAQAVASARKDWECEADQRRRQALDTVAATLSAACRDAEVEAAALAEQTITTVLAMLSSALPELCRDHRPNEARALVRRILPLLRYEPQITVRVNHSLARALEADIAELELEGMAITVAPARLEPGDVRITWENGSLRRDTNAIISSIQDALAELGLAMPQQGKQERRLVHAE